jgi:hypothetical protein
MTLNILLKDELLPTMEFIIQLLVFCKSLLLKKSLWKLKTSQLCIYNKIPTRANILSFEMAYGILGIGSAPPTTLGISSGFF